MFGTLSPVNDYLILKWFSQNVAWSPVNKALLAIYSHHCHPGVFPACLWAVPPAISHMWRNPNPIHPSRECLNWILKTALQPQLSAQIHCNPSEKTSLLLNHFVAQKATFFLSILSHDKTARLVQLWLLIMDLQGPGWDWLVQVPSSGEALAGSVGTGWACASFSWWSWARTTCSCNRHWPASGQFGLSSFRSVPPSHISLFYRGKCCCGMDAEGTSIHTEGQTEFPLWTSAGFSAGLPARWSCVPSHSSTLVS